MFLSRTLIGPRLLLILGKWPKACSVVVEKTLVAAALAQPMHAQCPSHRSDSRDSSSPLPHRRTMAGHRRWPPGQARPLVVQAWPFSPRCNFISSSPLPSPARLPRFETLATATDDTAAMAAMVALWPRTRWGDTFMALEDVGSVTRDFDSAPLPAPSQPRRRRAPPVGTPVRCHGDRQRWNHRRRTHPGRRPLNR